MDMQTLVIDREFAASREALWEALTDPARVAGWYGPEGWSVVPGSVEIDLRVGGRQRLEMHSAEHPGQTVPVDAVFSVVRAPEALVNHDGPHDMTLGLVIDLSLELAETAGGTRLTLNQGPLPAEVVPSARAAWESALGKLERLLAAG